ncbi:MAG: hypothetical protein DI603_05595 [Roseateles depolymerans]|uniref:Glutaredoxin domain-containing protein n=1 Tax=Roseateles depolymerans TaxID=76731 RepID=A0A2W5DUT6_9BURK|nr:MAG: hypothetical protein DI603_05595 [Roseateles depolymerans]
MPRSLLLLIAVVFVASWAWRGQVARSDGQDLAQLARPGDIRMISSETCPWCLAARRWFKDNGVPFSECLIERDARCAADYAALGAVGTPTLLVRGQRVIGFDRARILQVLREAPARPAAQRAALNGSA